MANRGHLATQAAALAKATIRPEKYQVRQTRRQARRDYRTQTTNIATTNANLQAAYAQARRQVARIPGLSKSAQASILANIAQQGTFAANAVPFYQRQAEQTLTQAKQGAQQQLGALARQQGADTAANLSTLLSAARDRAFQAHQATLDRTQAANLQTQSEAAALHQQIQGERYATKNPTPSSSAATAKVDAGVKSALKTISADFSNPHATFVKPVLDAKGNPVRNADGTVQTTYIGPPSTAQDWQHYIQTLVSRTEGVSTTQAQAAVKIWNRRGKRHAPALIEQGAATTALGLLGSLVH